MLESCCRDTGLTNASQHKQTMQLMQTARLDKLSSLPLGIGRSYHVGEARRKYNVMMDTCNDYSDYVTDMDGSDAMYRTNLSMENSIVYQGNYGVLQSQTFYIRDSMLRRGAIRRRSCRLFLPWP